MKRFLIVLLLAVIAVSYCGKGPRPILPVAEQFYKAKTLYDKGKYYRAQVEFENLIYTYPGNTVIDTAQYYLGMCYYNQKDYGLATGELKRLIAIYPTSQFADDSQYYIAMSHYKMSPKYALDQTETVQAITEFNNLVINYSSSEYVKDARERIRELEDKLARKAFKTGELYLKLHDYGGALTYFTYVRDNYPTTDWAIRSFYYSGEAQFKMDKYTEAKDTFEKFLMGFGEHELAEHARKKLQETNERLNPEEG